MPELPEVEYAANVLRSVAEGRTLRAIRLLHPALEKRLSSADRRRVVGSRVERIERRGKHQLLHLSGGRVLHVHFRMAGDWSIGRTEDPPPPSARALLEFDDGSRVALVDSRMLSTIALHAAGDDFLPPLGPEPSDVAFGAAALRTVLRSRRGPIKPALLDQRVVAGLGNIYAAEALWRARISPRAAASSLSMPRLERLVVAIRESLALGEAAPARYSTGAGAPLSVYDREGEPCARCRTRIRRIVQAGRSTYYCPTCQRR